MRADPAFCAGCGQKAYRGLPGFRQLMGEFFEAVFSLDNRLFRTAGALVIPGKLTHDFLRGRQKPYFHPLRLFFVSGVLMVATFSLVTTQAIGDGLEKSMEERRAGAYQSKYSQKLRKSVDSIRLAFPAPIVEEATDSLLQYFRVSSSDSTSIGYLHYSGGLTFSTRNINLSTVDYLLLTPRELGEKYQVTGTADNYMFTQVMRLNRLGVAGVSTLMGQAIWGLLLLVPLSAGLLKLVYIRHKRKYLEHFIFTLHTHAFLFLTHFFAALELLIFHTVWLLVIIQAGFIVYFLLAMKRVYGQRWLKTIIKAVLLGWGYLFLLPLAIGVAAMVAVLIF